MEKEGQRAILTSSVIRTQSLAEPQQGSFNQNSSFFHDQSEETCFKLKELTEQRYPERHC